MNARIIVAPVGLLSWMAFAFAPRAAAPAGPIDLDDRQPEGRLLAGAVLTESEHLAMPTALSLVDGRLVLLDRFAESPVRELDPISGAIRRSFGREGEGPGEFRVPRSLDPIAGSGSEVWVLDPALSRITLVDLDESPGRERSPVRQITLQVAVPITDIVMVDADRFMALGFFPQGRLAQLDRDGRLIRTSGPLPEARDDVPPNVLQHAYQGRMKPSPDRSRLVIGNRHAGIIEVFTADGQLERRIEGPEPFRPRFEVAKAADGERPVMVSGDDLRFGYVDVAVTDDRIYALFSGRTRGGYPGRANFGEYVHVFDWSGHLEAVLELDCEAIAIAVDPDGDRLYAVRHLPAPAVIEYTL